MLTSDDQYPTYSLKQKKNIIDSSRPNQKKKKKRAKKTIFGEDEKPVKRIHFKPIYENFSQKKKNETTEKK